MLRRRNSSLILELTHRHRNAGRNERETSTKSTRIAWLGYMEESHSARKRIHPEAKPILEKYEIYISKLKSVSSDC